MRAVVYDRYGPPEVLRLAEVERPVPKDDEVLVRLHATTVTRTDCGWRTARPFFTRYFIGVLRPKRPILGMEFAGQVEAVGSAVAEFAVGDDVFGVKGFGAYAEFVCVRESAALAHKPPNIGWQEAAAVCDGFCAAISCLRRAELRPGARLVVYGASGSIGTAAVQIAKHLGLHITAVCNTKSVELLRSLGADEIVNYEREDFTENGKTYDIIFDSVGKHSFRRCRRSLTPSGVFIETDLGFMWHAPAIALLTRWFGDKKAALGIARYRKQDVLLLKDLIERDEYRAVIDRSYPLEEVVEATAYVETGQKTGNVVLTIAGHGQ